MRTERAVAAVAAFLLTLSTAFAAFSTRPEPALLPRPLPLPSPAASPAPAISPDGRAKLLAEEGPRRAMAAVPEGGRRAKQPRPEGGSGELERAREILARHVREHPILRGTTVDIAQTPRGEQALAYYRRGRIVIDPEHRAGLERIVAHEVWHVIDWRDNGRIDWGEDVPRSGR